MGPYCPPGQRYVTSAGGAGSGVSSGSCQEGRYKTTWKREFKIPRRKAGPLKCISMSLLLLPPGQAPAPPQIPADRDGVRPPPNGYEPQSIRAHRARSRTKVDDSVPRIQDVNLGIVREPTESAHTAPPGSGTSLLPAGQAPVPLQVPAKRSGSNNLFNVG